MMTQGQIDAEIQMIRNKIKTTKSHLARIEFEKRLANLQDMKMNARKRESWEM